VFTRETKEEEKNPNSYGVWVLLAIIWHMTMIREQGKAVMIPKKKKKKKKRSFRRLSRQGLIYLYQVLS
jgi:hypothetical protein